MGMHFGVIAAKGTAEELLASLGAYGSFAAGKEIASFEDAPETDSNGERVMIAGDHLGAAFLLDPSTLPSANPDLLVDASRRLRRRVISVGGETVSGTYYLISADSGTIERVHWTQLGGLEVPYDLGERLAGEPDDGLDDVDGARLFHVLSVAGYDYDRWQSEGRKLVVDAKFGDWVSGPIGDGLNEYMRAHLPPGPPKMKTTVARRAGGGFDIVAPGTRMPDGTRVGATKSGGFLGKLLGRN